MSPFWVGLFDNLRGRGRNGSLFIVALPVLVALLLAATRIPSAVYRDDIVPALPWAGAALVVLSLRAFCKARARRHEKLPHPTLSCDELRKARAKLIKHQS